LDRSLTAAGAPMSPVRRKGTETLPAPGSFRALVRFYFRQTAPRAYVAVALQVLLAFLGGIGLLMLVPFLYVVGLDGAAAQHGVTGFAARAAGSIGLSLSLELGLLAFIALITTISLVRYRQTILGATIVHDFERGLRDRLHEAMTRADWLTTVRMRASETAHVTSSDIGRVVHAAQELQALVGSAIVAAVSVAVALYLSPAVTLVTLLTGGVMFLLLERYTRRAMETGDALRERGKLFYSAMIEHLAGVKVSKSFGLEDRHIQRFRSITRDMAEQSLTFTRLSASGKLWQDVGGATVLSAFLYFAAAVRGVPVADLVVLVIIFSRLLPRMGFLQQNWQRLHHYLPAFAAYESMYGALAAAAELPARVDAPPLQLSEALVFERVTFQYGERAAPALRDVNLAIPAYATTAVVGSSGAGKSTLADIAMGLLRPNSGRVLVDGEPLDGDRMWRWRRAIGYVPQDTFLFHDTIRSNLLWANPQAAENELWGVLQQVASDEFVARLPDGLDTVVGDRGVRLSGGERQRIALARAMLRRPSLLLLDEATSALDSENERRIQQALEALHGALTVVVIAHRISTIREADQIIVLDGGRVRESGSWKVLAERPAGHFAAMLRAGRAAAGEHDEELVL